LGFLRAQKHDGFFKFASSEGGNEQGFEQAFSSLAYAYLKDKAPRLLDFMVGFQLVERNDDNTKAMGVFGFRVGDQWLYAPVFFLNGDLKGHELLYIKKQDSFVPMKENWVNYLMSRKPHVLGEGSDQDTHQLGGYQPDVQNLSISPAVGIGKQRGDLRRQSLIRTAVATDGYTSPDHSHRVCMFDKIDDPTLRPTERHVGRDHRGFDHQENHNGSSGSTLFSSSSLLIRLGFVSRRFPDYVPQTTSSISISLPERN